MFSVTPTLFRRVVAACRPGQWVWQSATRRPEGEPATGGQCKRTATRMAAACVRESTTLSRRCQPPAPTCSDSFPQGALVARILQRTTACRNQHHPPPIIPEQGVPRGVPGVISPGITVAVGWGLGLILKTPNRTPGKVFGNIVFCPIIRGIPHRYILNAEERSEKERGSVVASCGFWCEATLLRVHACLPAGASGPGVPARHVASCGLQDRQQQQQQEQHYMSLEIRS